MNRGLVTVFGAILLGSSVAYANEVSKVTITQEPIVVQEQDGVFVLPDDQLPTAQDYYYLTIGGSNSVCYTSTQTQFKDVDPTPREVMVGEEKVALYCYDPNSEYFTIETTAAVE